MQPDDPTGPSLEKKIAEEEERRRNQNTSGDGGGEGGDAAADAASGCGSCDAVGCDLPDCDLPGCDGCDGCNLLVLVRLSSLLLVVAAVLPDRGGRAVVRTLIRGYRRWLTRFTPACPSTPSCSAYALAAVEARGVRAGLAAAAHRIRRCGTP